MFAEEIASPYYLFKNAGYDVKFASIAGGKIPLGARSQPLLRNTPLCHCIQLEVFFLCQDMCHPQLTATHVTCQVKQAESFIRNFPSTFSLQ